MSCIHIASRLIVCSVAGMLAAPLRAQAERLLPNSSLTTPGYGDFLLADLNADGLPDLAYTDPNFDDGRVCIAGPDGSFGLPVVYPLAQFPVAAADFAEDGVVDIACCRNALRVLPGLGDGTFGPVIKSPGFAGVPYGGMEAGDVDGDGHLDIAWRPFNSHGVFIHRGVGNGSFAPGPTFAVFDDEVRDRGLADMDTDGDLDVYASTDNDDFSAGIAWCANDGQGGFAQAHSTTVAEFASPGDVAPWDFDADGLVDLAESTQATPTDTDIGLWRNLGDGFQLISVVPVLTSPFPDDFVRSEIWIGHVDGDESIDILASCNSFGETRGLASFLAGQGGFLFAPPVISAAAFSVIPAPGDRAFEIVDLDGDGHVDVVGQGAVLSIPSQAICLEIAWGRGDGTFDAATQVDAGEPLTDLAAADLDGDGICDLLTTSIEDAPHLAARLGLGDGSFAAPVPSLSSFAEDVLVGDATGDGIPDALASSPQVTGGAKLLVGAGDGTFSGRTPVTAGRVRDAAFGDVDGDGTIDLAISRPDSGCVTLFKGLGDGSFLSAMSLTVGSDAGGVELADITMDGNVDVVVTRSAGASLLLFPLTHGFGAALPIELPTGPEPQDSVAADLDGDGDLDLATACGDLDFMTKDTLVSVHLIEGGMPAAPVSWVAELSGGSLTAADFDRDGLTDLLVTMRKQQDSTTVPVQILYGAPGGSPGHRVTLRTGGRVSSAAAADLDGNGYLDVVAALFEEAELVVALDRAHDWMTLGQALPSADGTPLLTGSGIATPDAAVDVTASVPWGVQTGLLLVGLTAVYQPIPGGFLVPSADAVMTVTGGVPLHARWPSGLPAGMPVYLQAWFTSPSGAAAASNALVTVVQ